LVCVAVFLVVACGDSGSDRSGLGSDDDDQGDGDQQDDDGDDGDQDDGDQGDDDGGQPDAGLDAGTEPDASTGGMVIDSVVVDGSFTQVRQGAEFQVVITGSGLEAVTDIEITDALLTAGTLIATATEVRAAMFLSHGASPGSRDVTLVNRDGSVIASDALTATPFVVEVDAAAGGRGTFESPMLYCEPALEGAVNRDLVLIGAGEHVCAGAPRVGAGVEVRGEGVDVTILLSPGLGFFNDATEFESSIHDVTVISSEPGAVLEVAPDGPIAVRDIRLDGVGIDSGPPSDGPFVSRVIERVEIARCADGVLLAGDPWTIADLTVEGCDTGLRLLGVRTEDSLSVDVIDSEFLDNRVGIAVSNGSLRLTSSAVRDVEATPAVAEIGISIGHGWLDLSGVEMTGIDQTGIFASTSSGEFTDRATLVIDDLSIQGGQYGIRASGSGDGVYTAMSNSVIQGQTAAAFSFTGIEATGFEFSNVELSVVSGFALEDMRPDPELLHQVNDALSTTLNGNSYEGQLIEGPVSIPPDLRIVDDRAAVQF
jgi:hypothetical protein